MTPGTLEYHMLEVDYWQAAMERAQHFSGRYVNGSEIYGSFVQRAIASLNNYWDLGGLTNA